MRPSSRPINIVAEWNCQTYRASCAHAKAGHLLLDTGRDRVRGFADIERFVPDGAAMKDGSVKLADLIVLATGYQGQAAVARRILGDAMGERIGRVCGFDEAGELHGMWRPTGQKGFWFHAGG